MEWYTTISLVLLPLIILMVLGVPIAMSLAVVGLVGIYLTQGADAMAMASTISFETLSNYVLTCIPLFVLMGELLIVTGISEGAFEATNNWFGRLPGGLGVAGIGCCAIFAAIMGSSPATAATVGVVAVPEMLKRGYDKSLATGSIAAGGALGILIPPSILMIIYGTVAEQSVGQLFMGGFIPGFMLAGMMMLYVVIICTLHPELAPRLENVPFREKMSSLVKVAPAVGLALLVLGVIYLGIATPTEAGSVGAFGALVLGLAYRTLTYRKLVSALKGTIITSTFIMTIMFCASIFSYLLSSMGIPETISSLLVENKLSSWSVMIAVNILYLIMGCFMDPASIVLLTAPIVIPAVRALGFDLVWFGIVIVMNMEMANVTPPFGFNLYVIKGIAPTVSLAEIIKGVVPFIFIQAAALIIVMIFPRLVLWLPSTMKLASGG
jgi:C4-dicarboxylate transporter, DctM subunit